MGVEELDVVVRVRFSDEGWDVGVLFGTLSRGLLAFEECEAVDG